MKNILTYIFVSTGFFLLGFVIYHVVMPSKIIEKEIEITIAEHSGIGVPDSSYIVELQLTQKELNEYRRKVILLRMRFRSRETYLIKELVKLQDNAKNETETQYGASGAVLDNDEIGGMEMVKNEKLFEFPYIKSNVITYGILPPIRIENKITVDYNSHFKEKILPEINKKNKWKLWETRLTWFVIGTATGVVIKDSF